MHNNKSTFISMVFTLFTVTFISASILGFVHALTKDTIEKAKLKAQNEAIMKVLPPFSQTIRGKLKLKEGSSPIEYFKALDDWGHPQGLAVKSYTEKGYSGFFQVLVGFKKDGTINGFEILEHRETPGLGSKMQKWFSDEKKPRRNIIGHHPGKENLTVSKDGGDVDAITSATITSRAFLEAVKDAYSVYMKINGGKK